VPGTQAEWIIPFLEVVYIALELYNNTDPNGLRRRRTREEINILLKQRNILSYIKSQETCMVRTCGKNA
jgi:hypothetical protein